LEPRKNVPTLIRAYDLLRKETAVAVPLILVGGKGWIYDDIFAAIDELGLRDHVRHLSGIFDEELAHLYHGAGTLVTPSFYEGFGLPALEAMHCGCPAVVSRRGSLPEIVGPDGLLIDDPEDAAAWADALHRILTDSDLRKEVVASGRIQAKIFSWEKTAEKTLQLYCGT
jgi:glycosyltransferase involved in cell wall biosynthesis